LPDRIRVWVKTSTSEVMSLETKSTIDSAGLAPAGKGLQGLGQRLGLGLGLGFGKG
jgi:hypothetical protein